MRKILTALTTLLVASVPALAWDQAAMNFTIDNTNFLVNQGCSGTMVDAGQGLILTANHCVQGQYEDVERETVGSDGVIKKETIRRIRPGTVSRLAFKGAAEVGRLIARVKVKAVSAERDLALLELAEPNMIESRAQAPVACREPVRGDKVYAVGNPMAVLYSSVTVGFVSSVQRTYGTVGLDDEGAAGTKPLTQFSSGIVGGNSGGALYNDDGELVGVPVLANRANEILGFAVPLAEVRAFLTENGVKLPECSK